MSTELRRFIELVVQLILISAIVTIMVVSATVGKASLTAYVDKKDAVQSLPSVVAYTKGSVGYYEIVDLIDSYGSTSEITVKYKNNEGNYSTMTFSRYIDGVTVKLALGIPQNGVDFTGTVYGRQNGELYKNGVLTTTSVMEIDMKLAPNSLNSLNGIVGNGVLDYNFIEALFEWAKNDRFVCIVEQIHGTGQIDRITLEMQK